MNAVLPLPIADGTLGAMLPAPHDVASLVRAWRERCTDLTLTGAARDVGVPASALSQWETGQRRAPADVVERLDARYGAGGALSDLAAAFGTPRCLPARRTWNFNFPKPEGQEGWAWVRTPGAAATLDISLGPFLTRHCVAAGDHGGVFAVRATIANPAATVDLDVPGWVDFGRGRVPVELGLPMHDVADGARFRTDSQPIVKLIARELGRRIPGRASEGLVTIAPRLERLEDGAVEEFLAPATPTPVVVRRPTDSGAVAGSEVTGAGAAAENPVSAPWLSGAELSLVREVRGYSRARAAEEITASDPAHPVTPWQVEGVERGREVAMPLLTARLDRLYRLDGWYSRDVVLRVPRTPRAREVAVEVPSFWVGPIWFRFLGPRAPAAVAITIRPWRKRLLVHHGGVATCRASEPDSPPFLLALPAGWGAEAGLGRRDDAVDVNASWELSHPGDAARLVPHYVAVAVRALGERAETRVRLGRVLQDRGSGT